MDNMVNAYKSVVLENYANFQGRLDRGGFWWFVLANFIVWVVLGVLAQISTIFWILAVIYWLALIVPSIAAAVRRLHDWGQTGWLAILGIIPIVLLLLCIPQGNPDANEYGPVPEPITS
jgi:uncharacterized membrane protein YhaH (DUF805 family)